MIKLEEYEKSTFQFQLFSSFFTVHPEYCNDRKMIMYAVMTEGTFLKFASPELRNDRDIVMAAVKQNGLAIMLASQELKNDPEIVMEAIKQNGWALQYTPFKHNIDYVMIALEQIDYDENWSNMYSVGDPIFKEVRERMKAINVAKSK